MGQLRRKDKTDGVNVSYLTPRSRLYCVKYGTGSLHGGEGAFTKVKVDQGQRLGAKRPD